MEFLTINRLLSPLNNCELSTYSLCGKLKAQVTQTYIRQQLEGHPDYPSLLAVSDVLKGLGIRNAAFEIDINGLEELPEYFIAEIKKDSETFYTVVTVIDNETLEYTAPTGNKETKASLSEFRHIFTGKALLAEVPEDRIREENYELHAREERWTRLTQWLIIGAVPLLVFVDCGVALVRLRSSAAASVAYTLLSLAGTIVGILLLWYEVDKHNPALQHICTVGKKTNCDAVLSSSASKMFGIGWSSIGFAYFAGSLTALLVSGVYSPPMLSVLSWLNVATLPYTVFSVYYQSKVAGQWCVLCLAVQALLILQFITAWAGGFHAMSDKVSMDTVLVAVFAFFVPFLVVSLLLPALRSAKEGRKDKGELLRLKHNPQIFEALLARQKAIAEPTTELGITIGNPDARYKLVKVCNPYCGPCAKAHPVMDSLLDSNPEVQVQIIFTATGDEGDGRTPPVRHLLAVAGNGDGQRTKQALDDWYMAETKDYAAFAGKYPMDGELKQQDGKIKAMAEWCGKTGIAFTPTFFVNGFQLPEQYSVTDLKYFLSV
ncbi:MAG: vitamin K epoxide reductase family protein [Chitinophagaceae bacterium]